MVNYGLYPSFAAKSLGFMDVHPPNLLYGNRPIDPSQQLSVQLYIPNVHG